MPDPRLVSRAQRAATMLERAWERWRATQGLEAEPMPPVSSYVGYSIEEPWGRPRVVFGVNAEDAERLAALLQESAGVGPDGRPRALGPGYRPAVPGVFAADNPAVITRTVLARTVVTRTVVTRTVGMTRACSRTCAGGFPCRAGRRSSATAGNS